MQILKNLRPFKDIGSIRQRNYRNILLTLIKHCTEKKTDFTPDDNVSPLQTAQQFIQLFKGNRYSRPGHHSKPKLVALL
jgi:hypothetical protein